MSMLHQFILVKYIWCARRWIHAGGGGEVQHLSCDDGVCHLGGSQGMEESGQCLIIFPY